MMSLYPVPQLMQCVARVPRTLWGVSRFNRGYKGPTVQVRRSSDGATVDCYSIADIAAHCAGTNGFVGIAYDQTGQGNHVSNATGSKQPKCHDSVTGVVRAGSFAGLSFELASSQCLARTDSSGFGTGNIAYTLAFATSEWAYPAGSQIMMGFGPDTGGGAADCFYAGHNGALSMYNAIRLGSRAFTMAADPASTRTQFVVRKTAGVDIDACTYRQNATTLAEASHASATLNLSNVSAVSSWGCNVTLGQCCQATSQLAVAWDLDLTGTELANLERFLESVRTS